MSVLTSYFLYQEKSKEKTYQPKPDMFKENYHIEYIYRYKYMYKNLCMNSKCIGDRKWEMKHLVEFLEPDALHLNSSSEFTYQLITT